MTEPAKSWWHTAPGMLTAVAAIITAVTGLLVALNQAGFIGGRAAMRDAVVEPRSTTNGEPGEASSPNGGASTPEASRDAPGPVRFPEGTSIRSGDLTYTILEGSVEPYAPGSVLLELRVRLANNQPYPANFWDASFRLAVDGLLRAPTGGLNEIVDGNSTSEAVVEFVIPSTVREADLQMGVVGEEAPALRVTLSASAVE